MPSGKRIVSFLPSATEMACALGLGDQLMAITHECDYPPEIRDKPVAVRNVLPVERMSQREIDRVVRWQSFARSNRSSRLRTAVASVQHQASLFSIPNAGMARGLDILGWPFLASCRRFPSGIKRERGEGLDLSPKPRLPPQL
jgi:hypothetical protein